MSSNYDKSSPKPHVPRGKQSPSRGRKCNEEKRDRLRTAPEQTVFKKAWSLLQNVCDSATQPVTLIRPNLSNLDGEKIEFIRSTLSGNGNFGDGRSESKSNSSVARSGSSKGLAERKSSSGGMNCILEIPEFVPSRGSRSRSGSREYQHLLDGTKVGPLSSSPPTPLPTNPQSFYPFRNPKTTAPEPPRFLDFNYPRPGGYAQGSRTPGLEREIGVEQQGLLVSRDYLDGINSQLSRINEERQVRAQEDKNLNINLTLAVTPRKDSRLIHTNSGQLQINKGAEQAVVINASVRKNRRERVESSMQTDLEHFTLHEDEEVWRVGREKLRPAVDPESMSTFPSRIPSESDRRPKTRSVPSSSSCWLGVLDIPNVMGYTAASFKSVLNLADHLVSNYIIPPDSLTFTDEEMNADEDLVAISLMRLIGIPQQLRHQIYQEALNEVTAIKDISSGSLDVLNCLIDWLSNGNTGGREELVRKARILATIHSEVEPDSEVWRQFERDVSIFSLAVRDVVQEATTTCSQTVVNQITKSGMLEHMTNSLTCIDVGSTPHSPHESLATIPSPAPPTEQLAEPTPGTSTATPPVDASQDETDNQRSATCPILSTETFDIDRGPSVSGYPEFEGKALEKTEEVKERKGNELSRVYERVQIDEFYAKELKRFAELTHASVLSIPTDPLNEEFNPNHQEPPIGVMGRTTDAFLEAQDPSFYEFGIASAFANVVHTISSTLHLSRLSTLFPRASPAPTPNPGDGNEESPLAGKFAKAVDAYSNLVSENGLDANGNPLPPNKAEIKTPSPAPPKIEKKRATVADVNGNDVSVPAPPPLPQSRVILTQESVAIRFGGSGEELIGGITEEEEPEGIQTPDKPIDGGSSSSIVEDPSMHRGEMAQILQRLQPLWSKDTFSEQPIQEAKANRTESAEPAPRVAERSQIKTPEKPKLHCADSRASVEKRAPRGRSRIPRPTFSNCKSFQYLDPSKASTIAIYVPDRPPHAEPSSLAMGSSPIPARRPSTTPQRAQFYYGGSGGSGSNLTAVASKNSYSQLLAQKKEYSTKVAPGIPFSGKRGGPYRINRHVSPSLTPNKPFLVLEETSKPRGPKPRQPRDQSSIPSYRSHHGSQRKL